jgi:phosphoribosylformimino-5-aminoimidazole carboxamide ribotide isomerase
MRVIGVIDIREGRAVHARGGQRGEYAPIGVAACERVDGDPVALARVYVESLGVRELYVADLDAIGRGLDALNSGVVGRVAAFGVPVFVDAGVSTVDGATSVIDAGASVVVVGLETLTGFAALSEICSTVGNPRVAFSVDLRDGWPVALPNVAHSTSTAVEIADRARAAGVGTLIVLDLSRVGTGAGVDTELVAQIRRAAPGLALLAGGGVRGADDLDRLRLVGCDGVLVATALLNRAIRV